MEEVTKSRLTIVGSSKSLSEKEQDMNRSRDRSTEIILVVYKQKVYRDSNSYTEVKFRQNLKLDYKDRKQNN